MPAVRGLWREPEANGLSFHLYHLTSDLCNLTYDLCNLFRFDIIFFHPYP